MRDLHDIPFFSPSDWQRDWDGGAARLACPRCGSDENFGPRQSIRDDRTFRRFRACKRCGMCQEADGVSPAYQTVLMAHECPAILRAGLQCRGCGRRPRQGEPHTCPRIVREGESYTCPECGTVLTDTHRQPWPVKPPDPEKKEGY